MTSVVAIESGRGVKMHLSTRGFPDGTVLSGPSPAVVLVLHSSEGEYMGSMEFTPEGANIIGEELRKSAEHASDTA